MLNGINSTQSFGSTWIPNNKLFDAADRLGKYVEIKGFVYSKSTKPQLLANSIDLGEVGVIANTKTKGYTLVGKNGGEGGFDTFIGNILRRAIPEAKYTPDIRPLKIDLNA